MLLATTLASGLFPLSALAQLPVTADDTLPAGERSQVFTPDGVNFLIDGGTPRGSNLFHSFQDFNVNDGGFVYFLNPPGIENILSRVTGPNPSQILGTLGVFDGNANLFLLNPNGILFGPNADLDLRGSFLATTAESFIFPNGDTFSATNAQPPDLLTINVPIGLQYGATPGSIVSQGAILLLDSGNSLVLAGGDILLDGTTLATRFPGEGRIELGAAGGTGMVDLTVDGTEFTLGFSSVLQRADISLRNDSFISAATTTSGGNIAVYSRNLELLEGSSLFVGAIEGDEPTISQAGDIVINATNTVTLAGAFSGITNSLNENTQGNAGNIQIQTGSLDIRDGALISSFNSGTGDTGAIRIEARDRVTLSGGGVLGNLVFPGAVGNVGDVEIITGSLEITDGSQLSSANFGTGNSGSIRIEARDRVTFSGNGDAVILSDVEAGGVGNGGDIEIITTILEVNNTQLLASTSGNGDAGNIVIEASDRITLSGEDTLLSSRVNREATGNSGNIEISTGGLEMLDGSALIASTLGNGEAGNIVIEASDHIILSDNSFISTGVGVDAVGSGGDIHITTGSLELSDRAFLAANTGGAGAAGTVQISASDHITLTGDSFITSSVEAGAIGDGGDLNLVTNSLDVLDQAALITDTIGQGNAGAIWITASDRVRFLGGTASSTVEQGGVGNSGGITITSESLEVLDGARLEAATNGIGNAGNIRIDVRDRVLFAGTNADGSVISAASSSVGVGAVGNSGGIEVTAGWLEVLDEAGFTTSTFGTGDAGNIRLTARNGITFANSVVFSSVAASAQGNAGGITLTTPILEAVDDSILSAETFGNGNAGIVSFDVSDRVTLRNSSASSGLAEGAVGTGGGIAINTTILEILDGSILDTSTSGIGDAGPVQINASDRVFITGTPGGVLSLVGGAGTGNGGNIEINTGILELADFAVLFNTSAGNGDAGDILINADERVTFTGVSVAGSALSGLFGSGIGTSGDMTITTPVLELLDGSFLTTNTSGTGDAGTINITASDRVILAGTGLLPITEFSPTGRSPETEFPSGVISEVSTGAAGVGGNIVITTGDLAILNGALLSVSTLGAGDAGNIDLQANRVLFAGTNADGQFRSSATTQVEPGATGNGGRITITSNVLELFLGGGLLATTAGNGDAGNITLRVQERVRLSGISDTGNTSGIFSSSIGGATGQGGGIDIRTTQLQLADAATINAGTETDQSGGNITIRGDRFEARDGSQVITSTAGAGSAGTIQLNIRDLILLEGTDPTIAQRQQRFGVETIDNQILDRTVSSGLFAITDRTATGDGGNIFIDPAVMILRDGARIAVDSRGSGNGGNIRLQAGVLTLDESLISATSRGSGTGGNLFITANQITLENQARLTTETRSTDGGNITLNIADTLVLRNNSRISTEAGTAQSGGNGGDIVINNANGFIVAVPDENSDIVANAFAGTGGNINITTQAIYGLEFRSELTPFSDITASSQFGIDGTVTINTPAVDPTQGLVELPATVVDVTRQIGQVCPSGPGAADRLNRFVVTGRGGTVPNPLELLEGDAIGGDWVEFEGRIEEDDDAENENNSSDGGHLEEMPQAITEAQGWVIGEDGQVQLVAGISHAPGSEHLHGC
jgi:filamentous hemagglutinin family protein